MSKYLVLAAPSGTGKTYLMETLVEKYSSFFYKVPQVTTRERREDEPEDAYLFLTDEEYLEMKDTLIGKTTINGTHYGSIVHPEEHRIGVIVLNELGFTNFKKEIKYKSEYFSIGLYKPIENIEVKRKGRNEEYLKKELNVLNMCDVIFNLNDSYVNPELVKSITLSYFMNFQDKIEVLSNDKECLLTIQENNNVFNKKAYKNEKNEIEIVENATSTIIDNDNLYYIYDTSSDLAKSYIEILTRENYILN